MVDRCKQCGASQSKYPLYTDDKNKPVEPKEAWHKMARLDFKGMNVKNLFKMQWTDVLFIVMVLFIAWAYTQDIEQYTEIKDDPCNFCITALDVCNYEGFTTTQQVQLQWQNQNP